MKSGWQANTDVKDMGKDILSSYQKRSLLQKILWILLIYFNVIIILFNPLGINRRGAFSLSSLLVFVTDQIIENGRRKRKRS